MVTLRWLSNAFTLKRRTLFIRNDTISFPLLVLLKTCTLGTLPSCRTVHRANLRLQVVTPLTLISEMQLKVPVSLAALTQLGALVLNPKGNLPKAAPLKDIRRTTLLLFRQGGTSLSYFLPLQSIFIFAGLHIPRVEKMKKLVLRLRILIGTRGTDRVLLISIGIFRLRVKVTTLPMGPIAFSIPEIRVISITSACLENNRSHLLNKSLFPLPTGTIPTATLCPVVSSR